MNIDSLVRKFLIRQVKNLPLEQTLSCPDEVQLNGYLTGKLAKSERIKIERHVTNCAFCLEQLDLAHRAVSHFGNNSFKSGKKRSWERFKRWGWLVLMLISFASSFLFRHYFLQFLALTIIFGVKWIFESGSTKTLIMIYDTWRRHERRDTERYDREDSRKQDMNTRFML